jgi:ankyrin repeat protein
MRAEWEAAARRGSVEALAWQLAEGADIDARDRHGQTALMLAALAGHCEVVALLTARGAALNVTAKYGLSALMLAVIRGHTDIVRRLVAAGADRSLLGTGAPGFSGKTALDLAVARGAAEQVAILGAGETA